MKLFQSWDLDTTVKSIKVINLQPTKVLHSDFSYRVFQKELDALIVSHRLSWQKSLQFQNDIHLLLYGAFIWGIYLFHRSTALEMASHPSLKSEKKYLEKVDFISLIGSNSTVLDLKLSKHTHLGMSAKNQAVVSPKKFRKFKS